MSQLATHPQRGRPATSQGYAGSSPFSSNSHRRVGATAGATLLPMVTSMIPITIEPWSQPGSWEPQDSSGTTYNTSCYRNSARRPFRREGPASRSDSSPAPVSSSHEPPMHCSKCHLCIGLKRSPAPRRMFRYKRLGCPMTHQVRLGATPSLLATKRAWTYSTETRVAYAPKKKSTMT